MNSRIAALLGGALILTLSACAPAVLTASPTPTPPVSESSKPTPTPTPTVVAEAPRSEPAPPTTLPGVDPAGFVAGDQPGVAFSSPSGNITCGIYDDYWGCSIREYNWENPEPTGDLIDCAANISYGGGFISRTDGTVGVLCRGGVMFTGEYTAVNTLPYNMSLTYNDVLCESLETGLGCRSLASGHGFTLSRAAYTWF